MQCICMCMHVYNYMNDACIVAHEQSCNQLYIDVFGIIIHFFYKGSIKIEVQVLSI